MGQRWTSIVGQFGSQHVLRSSDPLFTAAIEDWFDALIPVIEPLQACHGGTDYYLDGGALPDTWATATLGSKGDISAEIWERRRPGEPFFTVEFWNGWFDHWAEPLHT